MKTVFVTATALAVCLSATSGYSQQSSGKKAEKIKSEETIIIKDGKRSSTTIEVRDGEVFINGEKVANTENGNLQKKIIIDNDDRIGSEPMHPFFDRETTSGNKAMLGVYTRSDKKINGAEIERVMPGSAADEAGLESGDIITHINDIAIKDGKQLSDEIAAFKPGEKVSITYERNGKSKLTDAELSKANTATARVFRYPNDMNERFIPNPMVRPFTFDISDMPNADAPKMGIMAEDLTDGKGVKVADVQPNSAAEAAGLHKGDIIRKLNDETIVSVDDLQESVALSKRNQKIPLQYQRDGKTTTTHIIFNKPVKKREL
ncbi:MAG TPA: PDZ domain-containing protein [Flavipsychrobacter sp.]|jgi:S1-C subfamily serine protease|nr:PDZ domain-containing protein [Flavipsychrobacter sp.]